ncbi:MAG TPA: hypothetical protein VG269_11315 [Tepidisphaeraceae bacterium]|jgi:hypothetical protein|nr:hypothetical protein [Tepidisphaeraceae bacterium]
MQTLELLPNLPELTADEADRWMGAAIAEAEALRQHDQRLYPLANDPAAMAIARSLHSAWRHWADYASTLLEQLPASVVRDGNGALRKLRLNIGYARCVEGLPPEEVLRRHQRVESGESRLLSIEEARRELGLASRG